MSDFEKDFMSQVKGEMAVGVSQAGSAEKRSIDKRWFVILGLIVVLVIVLVVLIVVSLSRGDDDANTNRFVGSWTCDDGSEMTFSADGNVVWVDEVATVNDVYTVSGAATRFGALEVTMESGRIAFDAEGVGQVACERSGDE